MILSRDHRHMSCDKSYLSQNLSYHTATFFLTYEGSSERISLKSCNNCRRAISQNIGHLHRTGLYGNIF